MYVMVNYQRSSIVQGTNIYKKITGSFFKLSAKISAKRGMFFLHGTFNVFITKLVEWHTKKLK